LENELPKKIKLEVGAATSDIDNPPEKFIVRGPHQMTALPIEIPVTHDEIAHCLDKSIAKIETAIISVLERTPPELYADIHEKGVYLAGGGALLRGLDKRLKEKTNITFHISEDPLHAVARGTGIALRNVDKFKFLKR
jgi:rod shape-determining protein MreB